LFAVVGTTFGAGDTTTTFNLPNYTNRMPYGTTVGATGGSTTISTANLPSHTHTYSGDTGFMNSNTSHSHGVNDPGHQHAYRLDQNGVDVAFVGNQGDVGGLTLGEGAGPRGSISSRTQSSGTSISIQSTDINHTHFVSGTTGPTGSGAAFITPYLGISFIIKF
jgi:microcystin-dependent protein